MLSGAAADCDGGGQSRTGQEDVEAVGGVAGNVVDLIGDIGYAADSQLSPYPSWRGGRSSCRLFVGRRAEHCEC